MNNKDLVILFKALSDETRLSIIEMLSEKELCACHILEEFDITQPTLSYHMKILVEAGLVNGVKAGTWTRYSINMEIMLFIKEKVEKIYKKSKK